MAITAPPAARTVTLSIDGRELTVPDGTTIYDAAKSAGIEIPVLWRRALRRRRLLLT